jgi:ammonium transporter Rh
MITKGGKLDMEIVLNATLAGGVCTGANADLIVSPYGAMILGTVTGVVSSLGFVYLSPFL